MTYHAGLAVDVLYGEELQRGIDSLEYWIGQVIDAHTEIQKRLLVCAVHLFCLFFFPVCSIGHKELIIRPKLLG